MSAGASEWRRRTRFVLQGNFQLACECSSIHPHFSEDVFALRTWRWGSMWENQMVVWRRKIPWQSWHVRYWCTWLQFFHIILSLSTQASILLTEYIECFWNCWMVPGGMVRNGIPEIDLYYRLVTMLDRRLNLKASWRNILNFDEASSRVGCLCSSCGFKATLDGTKM